MELKTFETLVADIRLLAVKTEWILQDYHDSGELAYSQVDWRIYLY